MEKFEKKLTQTRPAPARTHTAEMPSNKDVDAYERVMNIISHAEHGKLYKLDGDSGWSFRIRKKTANLARRDGVKEDDDLIYFWESAKRRFLIYTSLKDVLQALRSGELKLDEVYGAVRYPHRLPQIHTFLDFSATNSISTDRGLRRGGLSA